MPYLATILIGVFAWVYVDILTRNEMVFGTVRIYAEALLPEWLYKPLIGCSYCVSGQIALWSYFFMDSYNFFEHLVFISFSIFIVALINKLMYGQP